MKKRIQHPRGFTLIELLTVIAIIGILAGILIPTVGAVRKQAKIAASKSQFNQYINAIQMFKSEYGYHPFAAGAVDVTVDLSTSSQDFIRTLSARNASGTAVQEGGNRRGIAFHSFGESEYFYNANTDSVDPNQLADRFNNTNIRVMIDVDGDGVVNPATAGGLKVPTGGIRSPVVVWVDPDPTDPSLPTYGTW